MSDTADSELVALRVAREIRIALERAAEAVERLSGDRHYQAAWKKAARTIRGLKPD